MSYFVSVLCCLYILLLLGGLYKFKMLRKSDDLSFEYDLPSICIMVPFRNEAQNLPNLLKSIAELQYPAQLCQIILINDHSTDNSSEIAGNYNLPFSVQLLHLPTELSGKKSALRYALPYANCDYLLFTDADCVLPTHWAQILAKKATVTNYDLVLGLVKMDENTMAQKLQAVEFLSVQMVGAFAASIGFPIIANGASLLCKTEIYAKLQSELKTNIASGDDVFLLNAALKHAHKIGICLNTEAVVSTKPSLNLTGFLQQKRRWSGKMQHSATPASMVISLILTATNIGLLTLLCLYPTSVSLGLFLVKSLFDTVLLSRIQAFWKMKIPAIFIAGISVLYPLYFLMMLFNSVWPTYEWKGRKLSHITK